MESPLSKCFEKEVAGLTSAKLLMNKILSKKLTMKSRTILMRILKKILNQDVGHVPFPEFEKFFHVFDEEGEKN